MMEDGVEAAGGGCVHRAWCGRSGRQAKPGQGLSSGETFGCASPAAGRAARWSCLNRKRPAGRRRRGGAVDLAKG